MSAQKKRHLLVTCAEDKTADLICERLGQDVLRVNWEFWEAYDVEVNLSGFLIADRYERQVTQQNVGNVIWRKPMNDFPTTSGEHWYGFHEFRYAIFAIINWTRRAHPHKLVIDPQHDSTIDKFQQMRSASKYFPVPSWRYTTQPSQHSWAGGEWVIKSVSGRPMPGTGLPAKVIYTTSVVPTALSDGWPWLIQQQIDAGLDLTIVYAGGEQFGFVLDRALFAGLDWRQAIGDPALQTGWASVCLPPELTARVAAFMDELGLRFGRLDFLAADRACRDATFLEVNPNGQWAWLDLEQSNGLFDAVMRYLTH